jgi:intraflagellar transport protein 46
MLFSDDIKHMFELITQFTPQKVEIETKLIPFIPEFIPAVGDIDAFIKIQRPDGIDDGVGLLGLENNIFYIFIRNVVKFCVLRCHIF